MKRPFGVTLLGVLLFLQGLLLALAAVFVLALTLAQVADTLPPELIRQGVELTGREVLSGAADGVLGVFSLVTGIGMLRLCPWAWFVAMTLQGVTLATLLSDYFLGRENPVNMLLAAVIVFYLNTRSVRQMFHVGRQREQHVHPLASVAPLPGTIAQVKAPPTREWRSGTERSGAHAPS